MVLGILTSSRYARPKLPRFVTMGLHRNLSLLVLVFLGNAHRHDRRRLVSHR